MISLKIPQPLRKIKSANRSFGWIFFIFASNVFASSLFGQGIPAANNAQAPLPTQTGTNPASVSSNLSPENNPAASTANALPNDPNNSNPLQLLKNREQQLLTILQSQNFQDPNQQAGVQSTIQELIDVQAKIQIYQQQMNAHSFNSPLNAPGLNTPPDMYGLPGNGVPGSMPGVLPPNPPAPLPGNPGNFSQNPNALGSEGEINATMNGAVPFESELFPGQETLNPANGANINPIFQSMDLEHLNSIKNDLMIQLRQIQQTLRSLMPQDAPLSNMLKEQQTNLLSQLRDVNAQINSLTGNNAANANASADALSAQNLQGANPLAPNPLTQVNPLDSDVPGSAGDLNSEDLPATNGNSDLFSDSLLAENAELPPEVREKMKYVQDAAALLQKAGLNTLASMALKLQPQIGNPDFHEETAEFGWKNNPNLVDSADTNPFSSAPSKEITQLQETVQELNDKVQSLSDQLTEINTQLKLLSRQAVSNPQSPATEPPAETTESQAVPADEASL